MNRSNAVLMQHLLVKYLLILIVAPLEAQTTVCVFTQFSVWLFCPVKST